MLAGIMSSSSPESSISTTLVARVLPGGARFAGDVFAFFACAFPATEGLRFDPRPVGRISSASSPESSTTSSSSSSSSEATKSKSSRSGSSSTRAGRARPPRVRVDAAAFAAATARVGRAPGRPLPAGSLIGTTSSSSPESSSAAELTSSPESDSAAPPLAPRPPRPRPPPRPLAALRPPPPLDAGLDAWLGARNPSNPPVAAAAAAGAAAVAARSDSE